MVIHGERDGNIILDDGIAIDDRRTSRFFSPYKDPMVTGILSYICTLSQTNSKFALENGWLEDWGFPNLLGNPLF